MILKVKHLVLLFNKSDPIYLDQLWANGGYIFIWKHFYKQRTNNQFQIKIQRLYVLHVVEIKKIIKTKSVRVLHMSKVKSVDLPAG